MASTNPNPPDTTPTLPTMDGSLQYTPSAPAARRGHSPLARRPAKVKMDARPFARARMRV